MGYALHVCVESTFRSAHDLGYNVILIADASAAFTKEQQEYVLNEVIHHFGKKITVNEFTTI
jgi:nicotinamidase-related amidase